MDWSRQQKNIARNTVIRGRNFKSALLLPSYSLIDVKTGLNKRVFSKHTKFSFIEFNEEYANIIEETAKAMKLDFELFRGPLEEFTPVRSYDMVYLDFCGPLNKNKYEWISKNHNLFTDRFAITLNTALRKGAGEFRELKNRIQLSDFESTYRQLHNQIRDSSVSTYNAIISTVLVKKALEPKTLTVNSFFPYRDYAPMVSISGVIE